MPDSCPFRPFLEFLVVIVPCIVRNNIDARSLWVSGKGLPVQFAGRLRIDTLAIVGYDIRNIMSIQQTVNVHTVTTAYGRLGKLFTFLYPSVSGTAVVGRVYAVGIIDHRLFILCSQYPRKFFCESQLFPRVRLTRDFRGLLIL